MVWARAWGASQHLLTVSCNADAKHTVLWLLRGRKLEVTGKVLVRAAAAYVLLSLRIARGCTLFIVLPDSNLPSTLATRFLDFACHQISGFGLLGYCHNNTSW